MSENMIFCKGDGKYASEGTGYQKNTQIFNKSVDKKTFDKVKSNLDVKDFKLPIAKWIEKKDMSDDEKENWSSCNQTGGYLKTLSYKEAWKEMWNDMKSEDKKFIQSLPNFDTEIFKEITGIEIGKDDDKKVELLKKAQELIEKANELKEQAEEM